jgi:hypothetical protein
LLFAGLLLAATNTNAQPAMPGWMTEAAKQICRYSDKDGPTFKSQLIKAGMIVNDMALSRSSERFVAGTLTTDRGAIRFAVRFPASVRAQARMVFEESGGGGGGSGRSGLVLTGTACRLFEARLLLKHKDGRPDRLALYRMIFNKPYRVERLNPPVPPGKDPGGVKVGLIDTGLNYTLAKFSNRLARDQAGRILGYDFAEQDRRPYDFDPQVPALLPRHHGTTVASIVAREAPKSRLVPLRYPGRQYDRFADLIGHMAKNRVRIAVMPLGGRKRTDWLVFERTARANPQILFVVSAGNDGRNLASSPVYPAAFRLANLLVVTAATPAGRLDAGANWGRHIVEIAVPAQRIAVIDHNGAKGFASGTSYAVPRVAALAARLLARHPGFNTRQLKQAIINHAVPLRRPDTELIRHGWIPSPELVE